MTLKEALEATEQGELVEGISLIRDEEIIVIDNIGIKNYGWEIKEEKRELSWREIKAAFFGCIYPAWEAEIKRKLGFK